jgi:precorrin-6A synthase
MTRRINVIGIGAGDPDYVTAQAVAALNDTQVFFAPDKGAAKDDLVALRREVCQRFIREPGYRFVELPDPKRAKDGDYGQAVADWHAARADTWAQAILAELPDGGVGGFLAWGDPSLYDSTLRILDSSPRDAGCARTDWRAPPSSCSTATARSSAARRRPASGGAPT